MGQPHGRCQRVTRGAIIAGLLCVATLTGCSASSEGSASGSLPGSSAPSPVGVRPISTDEADRLAVARFTMFDRGVVPFQMRYAAPEARLTLTGRYDFQEHAGIAGVGDEVSSERLTVVWNKASFALYRGGDLSDASALPTKGWTVRPIDVRSSSLDAALMVIANLGSDRPDNPQLLRGNGATWEGTLTIDGATVDRMTGPIPVGASRSNMTYFVDDVGTLRRAIARLGTDQASATIEVPTGQAKPIPSIDAIVPPAPSDPAASSPAASESAASESAASESASGP